MSYNDKDYFLGVYDDLLMMMVMAADFFSRGNEIEFFGKFYGDGILGARVDDIMTTLIITVTFSTFHHYEEH